MKTRRQAGWAAALGVLAALTFAVCVHAADKPEPLAITHGPYLQCMGKDAVTIVWTTNRKSASKVVYGEGDALDREARSSAHGLIDADETLHSIRLTGLQPGDSYRYAVESREIVRFNPYEVTFGDTVRSEPAEFTTFDPGKPSFRFIMINDVHQRAAELDATLQRVSWDGVDLAVYNGDMVNYLQDARYLFSGFLDVSVQRFAKEKPFVMVRGNHETRGSLARALMDYLPMPGNR